MKKLLNTLFVSTQGAYLSKEGETVTVEVERQVRLRLPIHQLEGIVGFGNVLYSPFLLGMCAERGVGVSMLTESGRFLARVTGPVNGNILLRREQYRRSGDHALAVDVARAVVLGKVANSRSMLQRALRDHPEIDPDGQIARAVSRLSFVITSLRTCPDLESVRGWEGEAGNLYFGVFGRLVRSTGFAFETRNRRPPTDNVNALLSFIYVLLAHDCRGALEAVGLDPQAGFLHRDRPGRTSLALDLMEELRSVFADRLVLALINLQQVEARGFKKRESGAVEMVDDARKAVLAAYQKRKQESVKHPFLDETVAVGQIPHLQALLLARHLRGDLDGYPPYLVK